MIKPESIDLKSLPWLPLDEILKLPRDRTTPVNVI